MLAKVILFGVIVVLISSCASPQRSDLDLKAAIFEGSWVKNCLNHCTNKEQKSKVTGFKFENGIADCICEATMMDLVTEAVRDKEKEAKRHKAQVRKAHIKKIIDMIDAKKKAEKPVEKKVKEPKPDDKLKK